MRLSNCIGCQDPIKCSNNLSCWCNSLPNLLSPTDSAGCYCRSCLISKLKIKADELVLSKKFKFIASLGPTKNAIEKLDYDINQDGKVVFTRWYHLRRGICCGSGCTNCPYEHINVVN